MRERKPPDDADPEDVCEPSTPWCDCAAAGVAPGVVVVVVTPPGGSSGVADGVTGPCDPGSPAYGVPAAVAPEGGSTS